MRWKHLAGGLTVILAIMAGCKQQCFLNEPDYNQYLAMASLPRDLDRNPTLGSIIPDLNGKLVPEPATIFNPERPTRLLSLSESFALALENGTFGSPLSGQSTDSSPANNSNAMAVGNYGPLDQDSFRVYSLNYAIAGTELESALSKFDARWVSSINWNSTDRPIGTALDAFQASGSQILNSITQSQGALSSSLVKPLPTGGVANITFNNNYTYTNLPARVNPAYQPALQFQLEQPLLQGFGVEINQIRGDHPGGILQGDQFSTRPANAREGIIISRVRLDQSRADMERAAQNMLVNVEIAYWNLYGAYGQLFVRETALRLNHHVWKTTKTIVEAGGTGGVSGAARQSWTMADVYEALGQFETSRSDWLAALGQVLEAERNLRGLLGMPAEDGFRLVPSDAPNLAPYQPDWNTALQEALTLRPELVIAREQIKASQFNLMDLKNRMLPDLRFTASYDINAIGTRMDGADPDNAFRNLASNHFNNWGMGLRLDWPLGFRDAHAGVRAARLRLAQAYWSLRLDEDKAQRFLAQQYRDVLQFQKNIEINRNATEAYNNDLNVRLERVKAGIAVLGRDQDILQTIRLGTNAMILYYDYISRYNSALAKWEYAKGTLLRRNNVVIAEGPLPCCAQVRAVEHERERSKALEIRQRAQPCLTPPVNGEVILPSLPKPEALPLPELLKSQGPLPPEVYENAKSETRNPKSPIPNPKPEAGISREKESPQLPKTAMPPGKLTLPPVSDLPPPGTETTGTISYPVNGNNNPDEETSSRRFLPQLPWNRDTKPNGSR